MEDGHYLSLLIIIVSPKLTMSTTLSATTALLSLQSHNHTARSSRIQRIIFECIETDIASAGLIKDGWYPKKIESMSHLPPTQEEGMKISSCITLMPSIAKLHPHSHHT